MLVIAHDASMEPVLEEVPAPVVAFIEALAVTKVEEVHTFRQVLEFGEHDQMKVVRHLARREQMPAPTLRGQTFERRPTEAVGIVTIDVHAVDPACGDVEDADIGENAAGLSCHRPNVSAPSFTRNPQFRPRPKTPWPGDCPRAMARSGSSNSATGSLAAAIETCPGDSPRDMRRRDMAWGQSPGHVLNGGGG